MVGLICGSRGGADVARRSDDSVLLLTLLRFYCRSYTSRK